MSAPVELILVRGHPGSGKTTQSLALKAQRPDLVLVENDHFFTDEAGRYSFDLAHHQEAKAQCLALTRQALREGHSVVVSNTFSTMVEMEPYLALGKELKCQLHVVEMNGDFPNTHQVPVAVVAARKAQFEPYPGAEVIPCPDPPVHRAARPRCAM